MNHRQQARTAGRTRTRSVSEPQARLRQARERTRAALIRWQASGAVRDLQAYSAAVVIEGEAEGAWQASLERPPDSAGGRIEISA